MSRLTTTLTRAPVAEGLGDCSQEVILTHQFSLWIYGYQIALSAAPEKQEPFKKKPLPLINLKGKSII